MPIPLIGTVSGTDAISPDSAGAAQLSSDVKRKANAGYIGLLIVWIFGVSVAILLLFGGGILYKFQGTSAKDYSDFIAGSLDPYLKECATTLGTIFGSTLGFVFGYYFKATSAPPPTKGKAP